MKISQKLLYVVSSALVIWGSLAGCKGGAGSGGSGSGSSYTFSSPASAKIALNTLVSRSIGDEKNDVEIQSSTGPTLCSSVVCFTPTAITGKYYGTGLMIQSNGNGMMAYFGQDSWSTITGTSTSYAFDAATPVTNTGTITCCTSTGDLSGSSSYIESVAYLFSYLDVTFAVTGVTGNVSMNATYTLRFVMADGAITDGIRGDVLVFDSGAFKWMDNGTSALSTTRPSTPVTMNASVVNYTNPFGSNGNQTIPVIYANVVPVSGSGVFSIDESTLRVTTNTYSYGFNMTNFIMFPSMQHADLNMISSLKELMSRVHLGGLPHSQQTMGVGSPADTKLKIEP